MLNLSDQLRHLEERALVFERRVPTLLTGMKSTIEEFDRRIASISVGNDLNLPVDLPMKSTDDVKSIMDWAALGSNKADVVSSIFFHLLLSISLLSTYILNTKY